MRDCNDSCVVSTRQWLPVLHVILTLLIWFALTHYNFFNYLATTKFWKVKANAWVLPS